MINLSKQRQQLRRFSDYKIRVGNSAIVIYQEIEGLEKDIAIIYKDGAYQLNLGIYKNIPELNKSKFDEVVENIKGMLKCNANGGAKV